MTQTSSRRLAILLGIAMLPCPGAALALQGCNQVEIAPRSEATVSVLLPDPATDPRPQLTVRNAHKAGPVDNWTACPITKPYGACAPPTHADVATVGTRWVVDPGDGMQLIAFRLKNGSASVKRDVRLCVQYGMP